MRQNVQNWNWISHKLNAKISFHLRMAVVANFLYKLPVLSWKRRFGLCNLSSVYTNHGCWDGAVAIANCYGLYGLGLNPSDEDFSMYTRTDSEVHSAVCKTGVGTTWRVGEGSGVKCSVRGFDHQPPSSVGLRMDRIYPSVLPPCLHRHFVRRPSPFIYIT